MGIQSFASLAALNQVTSGMDPAQLEGCLATNNTDGSVTLNYPDALESIFGGDLSPYLKAGLKDYAATARFNKETAGIAVSGIAIPTDRQTQAQLTGAYNYVQVAPSATIAWKLADGTFVTLNASQISGIATAVAAHVQACFAAEAALNAAISASPPTVTTAAQIDAAFAAVTT